MPSTPDTLWSGGTLCDEDGDASTYHDTDRSNRYNAAVNMYKISKVESQQTQSTGVNDHDREDVDSSKGDGGKNHENDDRSGHGGKDVENRNSDDEITPDDKDVRKLNSDERIIRDVQNVTTQNSDDFMNFIARDKDEVSTITTAGHRLDYAWHLMSQIATGKKPSGESPTPEDTKAGPAPEVPQTELIPVDIKIKVINVMAKVTELLQEVKDVEREMERRATERKFQMQMAKENSEAGQEQREEELLQSVKESFKNGYSKASKSFRSFWAGSEGL